MQYYSVYLCCRSYGVVLWEVATLAAQPYQGRSNEEVLHYVIEKHIMDKPEACPDQLYDLMKVCWQPSPKQRPTFCDIIEILVPYIDQRFRQNSYYFSERRKELEASGELEAGEDALDCNTPLMRSPHHHPRHLGPEHQVDYDTEEPDNLSRLSSLSYESHLSQPSCPHQQPCDCVVNLGEEEEEEDTMPSHNIWTSPRETYPNNIGHCSPNHIPMEERNCSSPPSGPGNSNEGSNGSSKSTGSSQSGGVNGFINGHVNRVLKQPRC